MQIHEITKRQRTDEGLLDKVKSTISAAKTKYNDVKNKVVAAGDRQQEKQWDKRQDKINQQAADAAKVLARKGFNVDTTTPAAQAQTPTRVKQQQQQKIAQLQQAFDKEFDVKSGGGGPVATDDDTGGIKVNVNNGNYTKDTKGQWKNEVGQLVTSANTIAYLNQLADKQYTKTPTVAPTQKIQPVQPAAKPTQSNVTPQSGIKEDNVNMTAGGIAIPAGAKTANRISKKDIAAEFPSWISQHIPGLESVPPEIKQKLSTIFDAMKNAKDPKSIDAAFQQYANLALSSVGNATQNQPGQQAQGGVSASAAYTRDGVARSLGLEPEALATLQQRIAQNKEQISNPNTGSKTIDTLIRAVAN
jgi:hypothetical protein